jgi:tryptophan synthase alpha chain
VSRIQKRFSSLKENEKALVAFITAGDPDLETTKTMFKVIEDNGADIIEIGVPFSDPLADGPVIQASAYRSLLNGTTLKKIIQMVKEIRHGSELPIVLMTSFNPVYSYGQEAFVRDAVEVGVDGVIIPDLPPEEAGEFLSLANAKNLDTIFLLAPTSTVDRIKMVGDLSRGFIYYISLTGTTGVKGTLSTDLSEKTAMIKSNVDQPVLVGFGISGPEQAKQASQACDGVIIGSAIVRMIAECQDAEERQNKVGKFVAEVKKAITN